MDRRVLGRITTACERIASIVDSILKLTEDGGPSQENVDLSASSKLFCQEVAREMRFARVRWQVDVDALRLKLPSGYWDLILPSLIKNAFEAAVPEQEPEVVISSELRGAMLVLVIADNGPRFDESQIPHFFEPFFTSKLETPGRGMGLTIAHVLTTRLGWTLEIRREQAWTRVYLKLSLQDVKEFQAVDGRLAQAQ
jgi:C4-dicarboxylate-specific signal transduction histidine kinase